MRPAAGDARDERVAARGLQGISAHIGKASQSLERKAKAMNHMHHNARGLVHRFYGAAKQAQKSGDDVSDVIMPLGCGALGH